MSGATDLVVVGVVLVAGYFAYQAISSLFGDSKQKINDQNNQSVDQGTSAANAATQTTVQATGQQPTLSAATIQGLANSIITVLNQVDPSDYPFDSSPGLGDYADQVNNYADWVALVGAFGTKKLLNGQSVDLVTGLSMAMLPADKSALNSYFVESGITDLTHHYLTIP